MQNRIMEILCKPWQMTLSRRWVVERTHAWLSKCRGILVRYEKKSANYVGMLHLACDLLWLRRVSFGAFWGSFLIAIGFSIFLQKMGKVLRLDRRSSPKSVP